MKTFFTFISLSIIASTISIELTCNFIIYSIDGYNCKVADIKIDGIKEIVKINGNHISGKNNENIDTLYFPYADCMNFLPSDVNKFFKNLKKFEISHGSLTYISQNDFSGLSSLQTVFITRTLLSSIPENTFDSLTSLETLILSDNKIRQLKLKTFEKLLNLTKISLSENMLEILPLKMFENNLKIEEIDLSNNKLRVLEVESFNYLKFLRRFLLGGNFCTSKSFPTDLTLSELELEIANKCSNDTEIVKSSTMTEMSHELFVLRQSANSSSDEIKMLGENLEKMRMKLEEIGKEKQKLINDVEVLRVNSSIAIDQNEDMTSKLSETYRTIRSLKENFDNLHGKCLKIEENYNEKVQQEVLRRNKSLETFESVESSRTFIKETQISSSSFLILLLVLVTALAGNVFLIIVIIRVKTSKNVHKADESEMSERNAHDKQ